MGRVRVFYGHEGVVPPTGLRVRSGAPASPEEVDEIVSDGIPGAAPVELVGELVDDGTATEPGLVILADGSEALVDEDGVPVLSDAAPVDAEEAEAAPALPDDSWTKGELLDFAKDRGFDMTGATKTKPAALARVLELLEA